MNEPTEATAPGAGTPQPTDLKHTGAPTSKEHEGRSEQNLRQRFAEIGSVGRAQLKGEVRKSDVLRKAKESPTILKDEKQAALFAYEMVDTGTFYKMEKGKLVEVQKNEDGLYENGEGISFTTGELMMIPGLTEDDGTQTFGPDEVALGKIIGVTPKGEYIVEFVYPDTGDVPTEQDDDGNEVSLQRILPKDFVSNLLITSENAVFSQFATDNPVFATFLDVAANSFEDFDPGDNFDAILQQGAEATGLATTAKLAELIEIKFSDPAQKRTAAVDELLSKFDVEESILASREDFKQAMDALGLGSQGFKEEFDRLLEEFTSVDEKTNPQRKDELKKKIALLSAGQKAWEAAENSDKSPVDIIFTEMQNGGLKFDTVVQAIQGEPDKLMEFLTNYPGLGKNISDTERAQLLKWLGENKGKIGKGLLWAMVIALVGSLAVPVATVVAIKGAGDAVSGAAR